jgi:hypothetical protein
MPSGCAAGALRGAWPAGGPAYLAWVDDGDGCGCGLLVLPGGVLPAPFVGAGEVLEPTAGDVEVADGDGEGDREPDGCGLGDGLRLDDPPVDPEPGWPDMW